MTNKKKQIDIEEQIELKSEELQEILGSVPSWLLRFGTTYIAIFILILFVGSAVFRYPDIISTTMILTSTNPPYYIVAKTSGKLKELNISDDQIIKKGDYLAVIENPASTQDIQSLKQYIIFLNQQIDTIIPLPSKKLNLGDIQPLYSNFYMTLFDYQEFKRLQYYTKKIDLMHKKISQQQAYYHSIIAQETIIHEQFQLNKKQYQRDSILNKRGVISLEDLESTKNQYLKGLLSLESFHSTIQNTRMQITQMQESLLDIEFQYFDKKNQLEILLKTQIEQLLAKIKAWELDYALVASIEGKVSFNNYWVENQDITTGETVFTIVPQETDQIIGKAQMPLTRSGKVEVGQMVNIRFANFPENEYGVVKGVVKNISIIPGKDIQGTEYYTVGIELPNGLETTYKKSLPYLPEMHAQADIITNDISLLERFFMPLRKVWTEGMK